MTRGKEQSNNQLPFDVMVFPHPLVEHHGMDGRVVRILQTDRKWQALEGDRAGLVDIKRDFALIIHPQSLQPDFYTSDTTLSDKQRLAGITVLTGPITNQDDIRDRLSTYQKPLAHGGLLVVIEQKSDRRESVSRIVALQQAGFVYPTVTEREDYIVWHANKEKSGDREPVNVWESKNGGVARTLLDESVRKFTQSGFIVVDSNPIQEKLSRSTYIPGDLEKLGQGDGFIVQAPCGCKIEHSLSGYWNITQPDQCDGKHAGLAEAIEQFEQLTPFPQREFASTKKHSIQTEHPSSLRFINKHGGCGGIILEQAFELQPVHDRHKRYVRFQIDTVCTSCGDIFRYKTRIVDVPV